MTMPPVKKKTTQAPNLAKAPKAPKACGGGSTAFLSKKARAQSNAKSRAETDGHDPITYSEDIILEDASRRLFSRAQFLSRRDASAKSDPTGQPTPIQISDETWPATVGDFACARAPRIVARGNGKWPPGKTGSVAPFSVPWRPCQVLSLFRERVSKKLSTKKHWGSLKVEVRWLYRHADLDVRNRRREQARYERSLEGSKKTRAEEVFETGHVAVLDASSLQGRLARRHGPGCITISDGDSIKYHCCRYYLHEDQDIFQAYEFEWEGILTRGLNSSKVTDAVSRKATFERLGLPFPESNDDSINNDEETSVALPSPSKSFTYRDEVVAYYPYCNLTHRWSNLTHRDLYCSRAKRNSFPRWQLCVGDVVAVHYEESLPASGLDAIHGRNKWYPYSVPWSHCQVTAIYRTFDKNETIPERSCSVSPEVPSIEIRWFPRVSDAQLLGEKKKRLLEKLESICNDGKRTSEVILEGKQLSNINCCSLLGPICIQENPTSVDECPASKFLTQNRRIVSDSVWCDENGMPKLKAGVADYNIRSSVYFSHASQLVQDGFDASKQYKSDLLRGAVLDAVLQSRRERVEQMMNDQPEAMEDDIVETGTANAVFEFSVAQPASCEERPHKKRRFFPDDTSVSLPPPSKTLLCKNEVVAHYPYCKPADRPSPERKLCVGDVVAVHCEESVPPLGADANFSCDKWYPYSVPWSHCQVTAIYRTFDKKETIPKGSCSVSPEVPSIEIRWFPRVSEALPVCQGKKMVLEKLEEISNGEHYSEVILEGKQLSTIECSSVLGPICIEDPKSVGDSLASKFLTQTQRIVSDSVLCNESGKPTLKRPPAEYDLSQHVQYGFDASKMYRSDTLRVVVLDAVLQSRKKRVERMMNDRLEAIVDDIVETDTVKASSKLKVAETAGRKRRPQKKRRFSAEETLVSLSPPSRTCRNEVVEQHPEAIVDDTVETDTAKVSSKQKVAETAGCKMRPHKKRRFFPEDTLVSLPPPSKTLLCRNEVVAHYPYCKPADMRSPEWKLCVGDVVAIHCEESVPPLGADANFSRGKWYPYSVPWSHCQVTAIYQTFDKKETIPTGSCSVSPEVPSIEIRWFPRVSEALPVCQGKKRMLEKLEEISNGEHISEVILEGKQLSTIECSSVLGPIYIEDPKSVGDCPASKFLTQTQRIVSDSVWCDESGKPTLKRRPAEYDLSQHVQCGIDASKMYRSDALRDVVLDAVLQSRKERVEQVMNDRLEAVVDDIVETSTTKASSKYTSDLTFTAIGKSAPGCKRRPQRKRRLQRVAEAVADANLSKSQKLRTSTFEPMTPGTPPPLSGPKREKKEEHLSIPHETRVSICTDPFHVDVSALKSFYEEMEITPDFDAYDDFYDGGCSEKGKTQWKVKLGDTVTVNVELMSPKDSNHVNFPFVVHWGLAEVVVIYKNHKTKESCMYLRNRPSDNISLGESQPHGLHGPGDIMVEVRWIYRAYEIPGSRASNKPSESAGRGELEEVFETDQIDTCSADCILSPLRLHDTNKQLDLPSKILGMPCIHCHCSRLWSIHRRSFLPSGSLSNRVSRGRLYSAHKSALNKLVSPVMSSVLSNQQRNQSWSEAFQAAIHQLSLAEAAQDAQENGMVLACRERERAQITSFLRKAIVGLVPQSNRENEEQEEEENALKSSMFIAGPPGTGKTASVRSVIAELQREQHEGSLPEFNFISLNGMELRHAFDAYVKFWEAVSGTRKERLKSGDAAYKLENYFCGDQHQEPWGKAEEECHKGPPVTVLMLDELDYLVTQKETLIYNFFDWPLRATTARLVVVGISNTITLPEKMSPRVQSRMGGNRCYFRSYNVEDTITILKTRLGMLGENPGYVVFEEDAIKFAARKTANLSGDIRKAFRMCKVAAENVYQDYTIGKLRLPEGSKPVVRISDVQKSSRDAITSIVIMAVSCSTNYEALLLISIGALKKTSDDGMFSVKDILTKIGSIANASGEPRYMNAHLSFADVLEMVDRLGAAGVIQLNTYMSSPWPWISTHLHAYEIRGAYRNTRHRQLADKHLAEQKLF